MQEATEEAPFQVRAYILANGVAFLHYTLGPHEAERVVKAMSPGTREAISTLRPNDWAPASALAELHRTVAALAQGDAARARDLLVACGVFVAQEAEKTHLQLLLKLITPEHFVASVPEIFARDFTRGTLLVELEPGRLVCRTQGLSGLDHIVCTSTGFVLHVLRTMGKTIRSTRIDGWSLAEPYRDGASFELTW